MSRALNLSPTWGLALAIAAAACGPTARVAAQEIPAPETPAATMAPVKAAPAAKAPAATEAASREGAETAAAGADANAPMVDNSWFSVGWPKVKMPEFSWKPWQSDPAKTPQSPTEPAENPVSQALDRVADTSKRAAGSVRNAWGSAMNKFASFGSGPKEGVAPSNEAIAKGKSGGLFSRFFGTAEQDTETPQTVSEFLAQERGKTTLK